MITISDFPIEILSQVFLECLPFSDFETPTQYEQFSDVHSPPWVLTQVCTQWRTVTLNTPHLWSTIVLKWEASTWNRNTKVLEYWLAHSGSALLNLSMIVMRTHYWGSVQLASHAIHCILNAILPVRHRWKSVVLSLHSPHVLDTPSDSPVSLPKLQSLTLNGIKGGATRWFASLKYPNMTKLELGYWFEPPQLQDFPWHQLTHLKFGRSYKPSILCGILRECSTLTFLSLDTIKLVPSDESNYPSTILPNVTHFEFHGCSPYRKDFLNAVTFPSLSSFYMEYLTPDLFGTIATMFGRVRDSLNHFGLDDPIPENEVEDNLILLLGIVPRLSSLALSVKLRTQPHDIDRSLLEKIATSELLPSLQELSLQNTRRMINEEQFKHLITRRNELRVHLDLARASKEFKTFLDWQKDRVAYSVLEFEG